MADAEELALELSQPLPEGEIESLEDDPAQAVGVVAFGKADARERIRMLAFVYRVQVEPPAAHRAPRCLCQAVMAGEDVREPFLGEHVERLAQTVEEVGRGRVGEEA